MNKLFKLMLAIPFFSLMVATGALAGSVGAHAGPVTGDLPYEAVHTNTVCRDFEVIRNIFERAKTHLDQAVGLAFEAVEHGLCVFFPTTWVPVQSTHYSGIDATGAMFEIAEVIDEEGEGLGTYTLAFPGLNTR